MDVFAHTFWTNLLFHFKYNQQRRLRYLAAFFGVVPDLVGFAPLFVYMVFSGRIFNEEFPFVETNWTFGFAEHAYNYTHSLVVFLAVFSLVLLIGNIYRYWRAKSVLADKDISAGKFKFWFFWPMLGWPFHILLDLPTHPDFYHTPFMFPLSDFKYTGGVSWAHPVFMAINYGLLITAYIALYFYQKRKYGRKA